MLENAAPRRAVDADPHPADERVSPYLEEIRTTLLAGRRSRGRRVGAAIGHALAFTTWQSLAGEQGLDDRQAAELMCRLVESAAD